MWRLIGLLPLREVNIEAHRRGKVGLPRTIYHEGSEAEMRHMFERLGPQSVLLELVRDGVGVVERLDRLADKMVTADDETDLGHVVLGEWQGQ